MNTTNAKSRRKRMMGWLLLSVLLASVALPLTGYVISGELFAEEATNPRSDYWREVRQGTEGYTALKDHAAGGVLINSSGDNWRQLRNGPIAVYGGWFLLGMLGLIAVFYVVFGRVKIEQPRTGVKIPRFNILERMLHWYVAILFIVMAITGLSLLFGREVLIPLLGKEGFADYAAYALMVHNAVGPYFMAGMVVMVLVWLVDNIPIREDLTWFVKGGGIVGNAHPVAGRMNGGEKAWYWLNVFAGLTVCVTGLILLFPIWGQSRGDMQLAHVIHAILAIAWIAATFGHIYIATLGSEGSLESMVQGDVDESWAKQHHSLWYADMQEQAQQRDTEVTQYREKPV